MGEVAIPAVLVVAVAVSALPGNVPLGPDAGALNVTVAPTTGALPASRTVAAIDAKAVPVFVDWLAPDVAVIVVGMP